MAACIRMGVEFYREGVSPELTEIDRLTRRREGEGTWPHGTYHALNDLGFEIAAYEPAMDYAAFIEAPESYIKSVFVDKPEFLEWLLAGHDVNAAGADAKELMARGIEVSREIPDIAMIEEYLERGWLVIPNIDMYVLQGREGGPEGHAVLIYGINENGLLLHDPDAEAGTVVSVKTFESAWNYTGAERREMLAFRPK